MGTRIIEIPPGNDCPDCWDPGETPSYVYVMFSDVQKGNLPNSKQLPNNVLYKCEQVPGHPCEFFYNQGGPGWQIGIWKLIAPIRWVVSAIFIGVGTHFSGMNWDCFSDGDLWSNNNWSPIFFFGWGGFATVILMETALELIEAMNIPDGDTFLEVFVKDGTNLVYKFCNVEYSMNQKFLLSP